MSAVVDHWHELVTVSLLGTDRREPPEPPPGPVADVVADAVRASASGRMLAAVAATVAARRAGIRPDAPAAPLAPPPTDDRPMLPAAAARRWHDAVGRWPVLEDEWLAVAEAHGWRPAPDVLVGLLRRHRHDAARWDRVVRFGGPLAGWLTEHRRELLPPSVRRGEAGAADPAVDVPALPVPPDLVPALAAGADVVVPLLVGRVAQGAYGPAHRGVLVNFIARCRPDVLEPLAAALGRVDPVAPWGSLASTLADLAGTRGAMLAELGLRGRGNAMTGRP